MRLYALRRMITCAIATASLAGCSGARTDPSPQTNRADPRFPTGYQRWQRAAESVRDEVEGEIRWHYRSPASRLSDNRWLPGSVLVKAHNDARDPAIVTRIDVRIRSGSTPYGGWTYLSFDPATRQALPDSDPETCHLCHAAAPVDGTFVVFE